MNAIPLKASARYLAGWGVLLFFIVLLTLIFNFLGTIICAVLAGMMLGAGRVARWHTVVISFFFPSCIFGVLVTTKAELLGWQVLMLTVLCFSVFWLSYLATAALLFYESKGPVSQSQPHVAVRTPAPVTEVVSEASVEQLTLAALEGNWRCKARLDGQVQDRVMEIREQRLSLSVVERTGRVRVVGRAQVELATRGAEQRFSVAPIDTTADNWVAI